MRIPTRAIFRLAMAAMIGAAGAAFPGVAAAADPAPIEQSLPDSTYLFIKAGSLAKLKEAMSQTQGAKLWSDPAFKAFLDEVKGKLEPADEFLKQAVDKTLVELLEMPQGQVSLALVDKKHPKIPVSLLIAVDAGKNAESMESVFGKLTEQAEKEDAKVATEKYEGITLHIIQAPEKKEDEKKDGDKKGEAKAQFPIVWANQSGLFHISTDVDALKELISAGGKRENSLAKSESYQSLTKRFSQDPHVVWYVDLAHGFKRALRYMSERNEGNGNAQNAEAMFNALGLGGLKVLGGSVTYNIGKYDGLSKSYLITSGAPQGVLKLFPMPKKALRPEPWAPATVASYRTYSWNLDAVYTAINDLVNMFAPGALANIEGQLAVPGQNETLKFDKDIFGPLGNRVTIVGDYKKPINEKSQRILFGIALDDSKAFESTLSKLFQISGAAPKKRDFQGTTIYDFDITEPPAAAAGGAKLNFEGPISVAIAKDTLFVALGGTLLEQALRGGASLADDPAFQAVAKEFPEAVSSMSFTKLDDQIVQMYEMIKSGKLFENAGNGPKLDKMFDMSKLPPAKVFTKYLSPVGGYMLQEEDGMSMTTFSLRKATP